MKPILDFIGGMVLSIVTAPLVLMLAALNAAVLRGNPFFIQERVGRNGKTFPLFKLRTMHYSRRRASLPFIGPERRETHKSESDPRLTGFGAMMRKWSLDELPQFWNVLFGHMSLVGPRPELIAVVDRYEPWQHLRHEVRPGVTGLWQISGRGETPMHEATSMDLEYISKMSLWADIKILAATPVAALGRRKGF